MTHYVSILDGKDGIDHYFSTKISPCLYRSLNNKIDPSSCICILVIWARTVGWVIYLLLLLWVICWLSWFQQIKSYILHRITKYLTHYTTSSGIHPSHCQGDADAAFGANREG